MIDSNTREELARILQRSLVEGLTEPGNAEPLGPTDWPDGPESESALLIMMTLSGYDFLSQLCLLVQPQKREDAPCPDHFNEVANTLCGALKRQLRPYFPEIGMSTPNHLHRGCLPYLKNPDGPFVAAQYFAESGLRLYTGLLVSPDSTFSLSSAPVQAESPEVAGELEFF